MLLSFRFANHKSFRDEQQLNLTPVYDGNGGVDDERLLEAVPVAGIFGANASGKSNVISALGYVKYLVGESDRESEPGLRLRRHHFRLDRMGESLPTTYVVDLSLGGVRYTYGFAVDKDGVTEEWLYGYPLHRKRVIFERSGQDFGWGDESGRSDVQRLADIVAPTALFLSVAARFNPRGEAEGGTNPTAGVLHQVYSWLWQRVFRESSMAGVRARTRIGRYATWLTDPARRAGLVELLRSADIGLQDVFASRPDSDQEGAYLGYGDVSFRHRGAAEDVLFDYRDESSGTLRLLELAAQAIPALNDGGLFLVDEIDSSLHPLLTAALVRLFQSPVANQHNAQLIFTSHDATLLGSIDGEDILQRDQVWFTSKGDDGASELFALAEFKPRRQGENRQKRYLNGTYGAIPELSMQLFEQAIASRADTRTEDA